MVNSCCAVNCTNRVGVKSREKKITFHIFPSNPELRRLWTAALKRYDPVTKTQWQPGKHACLCSEHFSPEDFRYNRGYRLLREGAIPTRFNYSTTKLKKIIVQRQKDVNRVPPEPAPPSVLSSNLDDTVQNKSKDVTKTTNYSQWLLENLYSLRTRDIFCDTVLIVGQQQLKAHSIVLSAGSPFFRAALELYAKPGLRYLTLPGCDFEVLKIAVRFIYTGKLEVGKKYLKSDQRAELLNSLRKLGVNLEHLEGCDVIRESDADELVNSSLMKECTKASRVQSRADKAKPFAGEFCNREMKTLGSLKGKCSPNQFSPVGSSLHPEEMKGNVVQDAGCDDTALAPAIGCSSHDVKTPAKNTSVLSEMTNGWVLRSKTGVHFVEVPQELLAEIELDNQANLLDRPSKNALLNSLENSSLREAKDVHAVESGVACQGVANGHQRDFSTKMLPSCSESSVDPVRDESSIVKQKYVSTKRSNHVCPTCGKEFLGIFRYNVHLRVHTGEKPYSCKSCGKTFSLMTNLTRHMRSHTGDRRYLCHFCGHAFVQKSTLEDHIACIHTKEKKHMCTFCGKFFTSLGSYRAHSRRHEGGSVKFRREYSKLSEPMRQMYQEATPTVFADGVSRFVCKICKKDYASKSILAIHLKRHSIAKPFVCNLCKKSFWQRSHLDIHERSHTGETPFICSMCGKGFTSHGKLSIHEKLHVSEKPYKCGICGSSFSLQAYLKSHMRMHTDDRPYVCKVCGKKYRKRINLKFHLNRTHALMKTHSL